MWGKPWLVLTFTRHLVFMLSSIFATIVSCLPYIIPVGFKYTFLAWFGFVWKILKTHSFKLQIQIDPQKWLGRPLNAIYREQGNCLFLVANQQLYKPFCLSVCLWVTTSEQRFVADIRPFWLKSKTKIWRIGFKGKVYVHLYTAGRKKVSTYTGIFFPLLVARKNLDSAILSI